MFQTTLRNPLASPDIIGVSLGASAVARRRRSPSWGGNGLVGLGGRDRRCDGQWRSWSAWWPGRTAGFRLMLVGIGVAAAMHR